MLMKCKWFSDSKGFGFVTDDKGKDYFCHFKELQMTGFKKLIEGQMVEVESTGTSSKGDFVIHVTPIISEVKFEEDKNA